jgi:hypothetical protein
MSGERWQQRDRKLAARKARMAKHGRSTLTAIPAAEQKRAERLAKRVAARRKVRP